MVQAESEWHACSSVTVNQVHSESVVQSSMYMATAGYMEGTCQVLTIGSLKAQHLGSLHLSLLQVLVHAHQLLQPVVGIHPLLVRSCRGHIPCNLSMLLEGALHIAYPLRCNSNCLYVPIPKEQQECMLGPQQGSGLCA